MSSNFGSDFVYEWVDLFFFLRFKNHQKATTQIDDFLISEVISQFMFV